MVAQEIADAFEDLIVFDSCCRYARRRLLMKIWRFRVNVMMLRAIRMIVVVEVMMM